MSYLFIAFLYKLITLPDNASNLASMHNLVGRKIEQGESELAHLRKKNKKLGAVIDYIGMILI